MTTSVVPVFRVKDAAASIEWYRRIRIRLAEAHVDDE